jgi:hypothetical protein
MLNLTKSFMLAAVVAAALPAAASAVPNTDGTGNTMTYTSAGRAADVASSLPVPGGGATWVRDVSTRTRTATGTCLVAVRLYYTTCPGIFNDIATLGGGGDVAKFAAQGAVTIDGGQGDDQLYAWGIGVRLTGDIGDDLLLGSANGTAFVAGGAGADRIWAHGAGTNITGDGGRDTIVIDSVEPGVDGGASADTIAMSRSAAAGTVSGGDGNDLISTYPAVDRFSTGGATYNGDAGNDTINVFGDGSTFGNDTVNCGDGVDTVYADATDTVAADCENVVYAAPPAGSPITALPGLADQYQLGAAQFNPNTLYTGPITGF